MYFEIVTITKANYVDWIYYEVANIFNANIRRSDDCLVWKMNIEYGIAVDLRRHTSGVNISWLEFLRSEDSPLFINSEIRLLQKFCPLDRLLQAECLKSVDAWKLCYPRVVHLRKTFIYLKVVLYFFWKYHRIHYQK